MAQRVEPSDLSAAPPAVSELGQPVFHGYLCEGLFGAHNLFEWPAPRHVFASNARARPGYDESIAADEFEDSDDVLREKALLLLRMLSSSTTSEQERGNAQKGCRRRQAVVAYTGAGISTSAGVDDYASGAGSSALETCPKQDADSTKPKSFYLAQPTKCHDVLSALYWKGALQYWVQQNHDGLPQKAGLVGSRAGAGPTKTGGCAILVRPLVGLAKGGAQAPRGLGHKSGRSPHPRVPQCVLNEIHGSWYDCSNPVVAMSGQLRSDLFRAFEECRERADVVLALGTSLSGMNADSLCEWTAERAMQRYREFVSESAMEQRQPLEESCAHLGGLVICSLQKTSYDRLAALRIFTKLDRLADMLLRVDETLGSRQVSLSETILVEADDVDPVTQAATRVQIQRVVYPPAKFLSSAEPQLAARQLQEDVFLIPYNAESGRRFPELGFALEDETPSQEQTPPRSPPVFQKASREARAAFSHASAGLDINTLTKLDLREGARVRLCIGPHIGDEGEVVGKQREGHYKIRFKHALKPGAKLKAPFERVLGTWWVEALVKGEVEVAPVVTVSGEEGDEAPPLKDEFLGQVF
eukprot:g14852.t1